MNLYVITPEMQVMFVVGFIIFAVYIYALLRAIYWGHNSQREDMLNDPELRNYYARHGQGDLYDYDGMGDFSRFPNDKSTNKKKRRSKTRINK